MKCFQIPTDRYLCAHGCSRIAEILEIDNGHEEVVCLEHTFNSAVPKVLPERFPNSALPHWLNLQSPLNRCRIA
jgi:hypothetical protein